MPKLTEREIHEIENNLNDRVRVLLCEDWREHEKRVAALEKAIVELVTELPATTPWPMKLTDESRRVILDIFKARKEEKNNV